MILYSIVGIKSSDFTLFLRLTAQKPGKTLLSGGADYANEDKCRQNACGKNRSGQLFFT